MWALSPEPLLCSVSLMQSSASDCICFQRLRSTCPEKRGNDSVLPLWGVLELLSLVNYSNLESCSGLTLLDAAERFPRICANNF